MDIYPKSVFQTDYTMPQYAVPAEGMPYNNILYGETFPSIQQYNMNVNNILPQARLVTATPQQTCQDGVTCIPHFERMQPDMYYAVDNDVVGTFPEFEQGSREEVAVTEDERIAEDYNLTKGPRTDDDPIEKVHTNNVCDQGFLVTQEYCGVREFPSAQDAITTLTRWAWSQHVVLRKGSGNNKTTKEGTRKKLVLVCQCSGKYRTGTTTSSEANEIEEDGTQIIHKRRTKKTRCPFRINLNLNPKDCRWVITKMVLEHNHS